MTLRLAEEQTKALRNRAELEHRSMKDVARTAIRAYVADRSPRLTNAITQVAAEDAELLDRLSR